MLVGSFPVRVAAAKETKEAENYHRHSQTGTARHGYGYLMHLVHSMSYSGFDFLKLS